MAIKTLHVTNNYHSNSGGIRTFYLALLEAANRRRRPMRLVLPGDKDGVEEVGNFGRIYYVKGPRCPVFDRRYRLILPHTFLLPHADGLRFILQLEQPELVEICDKYSLCWLAGALRQGWIPGVLRPTLVGLSCERMDDNVRSYITPTPAAQRLATLYMRKVYVPLFDFHIAVSRYVSAELTAGNPAIGDRLKVRPMGVHIEDLGPERRDPELRARLQREGGGDSTTALLLYAGRLSPEKNLPLLVDMMEHLLDPGKFKATGRPISASLDCRLLIAGSGSLEGWLREQSERLGGRLRLLGQLDSRRELAHLLASVDVFVHPNPREPFGIGPLEAMASGTPLVAPEAGGVLEYADPSCAWLAEPAGQAFAGAVLEVLSNPIAARAKVDRARLVAERYSWQQVTDHFFDTYDAFNLAGQAGIIGRQRAGVRLAHAGGVSDTEVGRLGF
jgi:alpha-1,6-mannosyltransferase